MAEIMLIPCRRPAQCFDAEPRDCRLCNPVIADQRQQARADERGRIAQRVSERCVLRLEVGRDPLVQVNEVIQDLAHDIETDWADYEDGDDPPVSRRSGRDG